MSTTTLFTTTRTNAKMISTALLTFLGDSAHTLHTEKNALCENYAVTVTAQADSYNIVWKYRTNRFGSLSITDSHGKTKSRTFQNVPCAIMWDFLTRLTDKKERRQRAQARKMCAVNTAEKCTARKKQMPANSNVWAVCAREFPALPCTVYSTIDKKGKMHDYFAIDCDKLYMQSYTDICNALLIAMQACKTKFDKISDNSSVNAPKKWLNHTLNIAQAYCRLCAQYNYFAGNKNAEIRIFDKTTKKSIIYRQADYITFVLSSLCDESYDYYSTVIKTLQYVQIVNYTITHGTHARTLSARVPKSYGVRIYNAYKQLGKILEKSRKEYNNTAGSINDSDFAQDIATYCSYIGSTEKSSTADIVNKIVAKYDSTAKLMLSTYGKMKNVNSKTRSAKGFGIRQCAKMCGVTNPNKAHRILKKFESDILAKYPTLKMNAGTIDDNEIKAIEIENAIAKYALRKKSVQAKTTAQAVLKMLW